MMKKSPAVNESGPPAVGDRLQELRQRHGLSLDDLSRKSGVSKSMLSEIERNRSNPTVALTWRLASALGVRLTDLLQTGMPERLLDVVPAHAAPSLTSADGNCELRILGPVELAGKVEWYELVVKSGGVLDSQPHGPGAREHLTVFSGVLEVQSGSESSRVERGETARYAADVRHSIRNPGRTEARGVLFVIHSL